MLFGTLYIHSFNHALNAFTGITRSNIAILQQLYCFDSQVKYNALQTALGIDYSHISCPTYDLSLQSLLQYHYINKETIGNNALYSITTNGIHLLAAFNAKLDELVKEKIMKYGNGFPAH